MPGRGRGQGHRLGGEPHRHFAGGGRTLDIIASYRNGSYTATTRASRLDWVGRNHNRGEKPADNMTNFLYLDGHVETKSILQTVPKDASSQVPWEWGTMPYSITPNATNP